MLPPGDINWQLIYPTISLIFQYRSIKSIIVRAPASQTCYYIKAANFFSCHVKVKILITLTFNQFHIFWPIDTWPIDTWPIDTWLIDTWLIDTWQIDTWLIDTWLIDTWSIDTWPIDFWPTNIWPTNIWPTWCFVNTDFVQSFD